MAGDTETVKAKPPVYFSTLYYHNQKNRQKLPTAEEQSELEKLKTDYEGKRYQIPEDMLDIENSQQMYKRINDYFENGVQDNDIRWYRQHSLSEKKSDYDYRYWLQYEVEKMASGERSMESFVDERDEEEDDAMKKLYKLSFRFSKALVKLAEDQNKRESFKKNPLGNLYIWEKKILSDPKMKERVKKLFDQDLKSWNPFYSHLSTDFDPNEAVTRFINDHPIFYDISKEVVKILFKTINKATYLRKLDENELMLELKSLGIKIELPPNKGKMKKILIEELEEPRNKERRENFMITRYLVSLNQLMSRLHNDLRNVMQKWHEWASTANTSNHNPSMPKKAKGVYNLGFDCPEGKMPNSNQEKIETQIESSIRLSSNCIYLLFEESMIDISIPDFEELDYIYSEEYDYRNKSRPNIARLNQGFQEKHLNQGEHAIIRHFKKDQKRNMYCLPKNHKKNAKGGLLKLSKSKSQPADLERLIESGKIKHERFEFSQSTLDSLNSLQKTQWSINLDFLDFIAELTYKGKVLKPYPLDIRQSSWASSDTMKLRDIFITEMELNKLDQSTLSRMLTINSILKQSRKNIYNAPNVFWHSWSCDWRGRFNCRTPEISPQGADLSKSLLLFNEWKIIGERGKYWLYVRAYDLLHNVIGGSEEKLGSFDKKVESVEENLNEYLEIGNKLSKDTADLAETLNDLRGPKKWKDSDIFQKIAFLIEFIRIHDELKKNYNEWDKVKSGLPIHLDASCNGFQHISALTRNKPLAKSVNLISENNIKKDLYQEVADLAGEEFETSDLKQLLCKFDLNEHELQEFKQAILVRELCKPLVMVKGYGAKDLQSPICNKGGKKKRHGSYTSNDGGKWHKTIHPESILYENLKTLSEQNKCKGFKQFLFDEHGGEDGLKPPKNCEKAERLARVLVKFIKECINKKTEGAFEEIKTKLTNIIERISKPEDKIYLKWKITNQGSSIRTMKWKLEPNKGKTKLNIEVLPKGYSDDEEIINSFLLKSISKEEMVKLNKLIEEIKEKEKEEGKPIPSQNYLNRRLKDKIFYYLRKIYHDESESEDNKIVAKNHLRARFINGFNKKDRTDYGVTIDAKYTMDFDSLSAKKMGTRIKELINKIKTGLVPNFIHSFDAVHMQMVILELNKRGIEDIWSVHDSFGVHACHVEEMREIVKQTFVELHREPLDKHIENIVKLNSDILKSGDEQINQENDDKIQNNSTENNGDSDWINEVLESEYMIS